MGEKKDSRGQATTRRGSESAIYKGNQGLGRLSQRESVAGSTPACGGRVSQGRRHWRIGARRGGRGLKDSNVNACVAELQTARATMAVQAGECWRRAQRHNSSITLQLCEERAAGHGRGGRTISSFSLTAVRGSCFEEWSLAVGG